MSNITSYFHPELGNYKSHAHQTWPKYVPIQYLSFTMKWGCQSMGGWGNM